MKRKRKKKEIIVKTVFTFIFIFMLWWLFLMWERFSTDLVVGKAVDEVSLLMFWEDTQNRRSIPKTSEIVQFDLQVNDKKVFTKIDFEVVNERTLFSYKEEEGKKRVYEKTATNESVHQAPSARRLFEALTVLQMEKKLVGDLQMIYDASQKIQLKKDADMFIVMDGKTKPIHLDEINQTEYAIVMLKTKKETTYMCMKK